MGGVVDLIWVKNEAEYLRRHDWTGQISLIRHEKLDFRRGGWHMVSADGRRPALGGVALV